MCVGGLPGTQRNRLVKRRWRRLEGVVLQNEATGARDGIVEANAVLPDRLTEAISIMSGAPNGAVRGCAERRATVSMTNIRAPQCRHTNVGRA